MTDTTTVAGAGFTFKNGNVGLFPAATSNITGFPPATVSGITLLGTNAGVIVTGGANQQAEADLQVAATGLAAMPLNANYSNIDMANLGALPPGVYKWNAAATLTGALVLDAQGKNNVSWVFQFGTGLTTAVNSTVTLINAGTNGGSDDGIFWNAATGAIVIGDDNTVLGNYIAYTSVSFTGSTMLLGGGGARFMALNAAVSFAGPGTLNALGGPAGGDWTGGLTLNGSVVVPTLTGPGAPALESHIVNFSARALSGAASGPLIVGFVVSGSGKSLLLRGVGPALSGFGITDALANTTLTLFGAGGSEEATDSGWQVDSAGANDSTLISSTEALVGAFPLANGSMDSALVVTADGGAQTAELLTTDSTPGVGLVEVYDAGGNPASSLVNVSARAQVSGGSGVLIAGFVITGNTSKTVLIRGIGPALLQFGVSGALADPVITVLSGATTVAANTGWGTGAAPGQVATTSGLVGAFPLASGSADSALLLTLQPGSYTVELTSASNSTGVALVEVYDTQ